MLLHSCSVLEGCGETELTELYEIALEQILHLVKEGKHVCSRACYVRWQNGELVEMFKSSLHGGRVSRIGIAFFWTSHRRSIHSYIKKTSTYRSVWT